MLPQVSYYVAVSIDGYIATPDGGTEWLSPYETDDQDYGYEAFYGVIDGLLMGRETYDKVRTLSDAWPYPDKPCWVLTHRPLTGSVPPEVTAVAPESPRAAIALADELNHLWLVGGGQVAAAFASAGAIDHYWLSVMPLLLGDGRPWLGAATASAGVNLHLAHCHPYPNGVVQLHYQQQLPQQ